MLVEYLYHLVIDDGHVTYVDRIRIQETVKGLGIVKGMDLGLVETLSKHAPHGI